LLAGTFFNRVGTFIIPFLALYLTTERGMSVSEATFIVSLYGMGSLGAGLSGGILADVIGRRKTLLISLILSAIFMLVLSSVQQIALISLVVILLGYCTDLYRPAVSAVVSDLAPPANRIQAYGLRYWANNLGAAIGPLIAGAVAHLSFLVLFLGDAFSTLVFSLMIWLGVPETRPQRQLASQDSGEKARAKFFTAARDLRLWGYTILSFLFTCIYLQYNVTLPLDMHAHGLSEAQYGIVIAANALLVVFLSLPLNPILARFPSHILLAIAALLMGTGYGLNAYAHTFVGYLLATCIWTLGEMMNQPLATNMIARLSPSHLRGTYQGIYSLARGLSAFIAPALGGLILDRLGASILWNGCFILGSIVACSYLLLPKIKR
ncbi:MAG: MFS transporter, partial [Ktedonobacteraceae bacterium]|nr:MFS transporter [Ktedonobacteraceae bacterium]